MAVVKFTKFGGIAPSVDPRNLAIDGAQIAQNLDLRFGDFRPSKGLGSSVATVPAGSRSIFRTPSGFWLSSLTDTNYVNGQVPDAASERVYLTGRSGYPEAWQGGVYRQLGVPAPATAPTVTLVANTQFDQDAATQAQKDASTAVVNAVLAADTQAYLGAAVPAGAASPTTFDLLYPKVELHVAFDALTSGQFTDQSPQQRLLTKGSGITLVTDTAGPLGTSGGAGYGQSSSASSGGISFREIRRWRDEVDATWCVEFHVTAAVTYDYLSIQSRDYNLRELGGAGSSGWGSLIASTYTGRTNEDFSCRRTDGSAALPAGVATHVVLQCTGSSVQCYIDGTLCGSIPYALGLEMSYFGKSQYGSGDFRGKFDELRVTLAQRYSGTGFTKPTQPFPTAALPTGLTLAHGATTALPTDSPRDAAYLIQLTPSGAGFAAVNAADEYLRLPPFTGTQLTYLGNTYWAVALSGWRADGLTATLSAISTALTGVMNPAAPASPLLTSGQVATLAPLIFAAYDTSAGVLSSMLSAINAAQAEVRAELARATPVPATVATKVTALKTASDALTTYFTDIATKLRAILAANESTLFGAITSAIVNREETTRAYLVTYVSDWDEESASSPPSDLLTLDQNDGVTVVIPAPPSGRNVVAWRLYRSTTTSTGAIWSLVADDKASNAVVRDGTFIGFNISVRTYTDTVPDAELQEPCQTITWAEPPANLKGLVGLPNGIMVGFFDKTLCFCEPYAPYAWPVEYQQTLEHPIVAIGVFGQTAVVLTTGFPYFVSGADSASMSAQKIEVPQACVAARSVASVDGGVIYASPDGLCLASPSGIEIITQGAFNKADWLASVTSGAVGAFHDGAYYLFTG
jgi:hypothetical protein